MFKDWTKFEKVWLASFTLIILIVTAVFSYNGTDYKDIYNILLNWVISPVSAITGMVCVVLAARGSKWNYTWGLVNCITYGYVAWKSGYYGDMILNLFYFLPFQFIGFIWWSKHLRKNSDEIVIMRRLTKRQLWTLSLFGIIISLIFGYMLTKVDNWFLTAMKRNVSIYRYIGNVFHIPYLGAIFDASTEFLQIAAQILMTLAFVEQWGFWIATNVITIIMWVAVLVAEPSSLPWALPTLIMWIAYFINSIYGYANWKKGAAKGAL